MASAVRDETAAGRLRVLPIEGAPLAKRLYRVTRSGPPSAPLARFLRFIG
jgi:hypothetical protein